MGAPVIYLSAAPIELRTHRSRAEKMLTAAGLQVVTFESGPSQDWSTLRKSLRKELRNCSALIHLAGLCYGTEPAGRPPGAPRRSHSHLEYHLARDLRLPIHTFLLSENFPFDTHAEEGPELGELQQDHRSELLSTKLAGENLKTTAQFDQRLQSLAQELARKGKAGALPPPPASQRKSLLTLLRLPLLVLFLVFAGYFAWQTFRPQPHGVIPHPPGSLLAGLSPEEIAADQKKTPAASLETTRLAREVAQITPQQGSPREQYDSRTKQELAIASVASRHGKQSAALETEIDTWAHATRAAEGSPPLDRALAAFLLADYETAAMESGRIAAAAEGSNPANDAQALSAWFLQGHCRLQQLKFQEALDAYRRTLAHTNVETQPLIWSDLSLAEAQALQQLGRWNEAVSSYKAVISLRKAHLPPETPDIAWAMTCLAPLYAAMNQTSEAESLLQDACKIMEQRFGPEHPETALALANLGETLRLSGKSVEAESLLYRSIAINEKSLGGDTPEVARVLGSLARLQADTGRKSEAVRLGEKALAITERHFSPDHPRVARSLSDVAMMLGPADHLRAENLQKRALTIMEKQFGPLHAETASALNNLAGLLQRGPQKDEAETMFRTALRTDESLFGRSHPNLLRDLRNLAGFLRSTGRRDEAIALYLQALGLAEVHFGREHSETVISLRQLCLQLAEAGRYAEAEPFGRRALASATKLHGDNHMDVALCARDLAFCLAVSGKLDEAASLYEKAQGIAERNLGADHISVFYDIRNRAAALRDSGDRPKALEAYRRSYAMARRILGREHPQTLVEMDSLACMLRETKHYDDAEYLFRDLIAVREKMWGANSVDLANDLSDLAGVLYLKRQYADAEPIYRRLLRLSASAERQKAPPTLVEASRKTYRSVLEHLGIPEDQIATRMGQVEAGQTVEDVTAAMP